MAKMEIVENFNGETFTIYWDEEGQSAYATDPNGTPLNTVQGFWFAWFAFHPDTEVSPP